MINTVKQGRAGKTVPTLFKRWALFFISLITLSFCKKIATTRGRYCDYRFHFLGRPPHLRLVGLSTLSMLSARFFDAPRERKKLTTSCFVGAVDLSSGSYVDQNSRFAINASCSPSPQTLDDFSVWSISLTIDSSLGGVLFCCGRWVVYDGFAWFSLVILAFCTVTRHGYPFYRWLWSLRLRQPPQIHPTSA